MILGMINLLFTISTAEGGFVVMLEDVIVHNDFRHRGFGDKLLMHAIDYARKKGFSAYHAAHGSPQRTGAAVLREARILQVEDDPDALYHFD
jgi:GNAT superfamily N-acetyltransferase